MQSCFNGLRKPWGWEVSELQGKLVQVKVAGRGLPAQVVLLLLLQFLSPAWKGTGVLSLGSRRGKQEGGEEGDCWASVQLIE